MTNILLDVMYEDLEVLLVDLGWTVETVSKQIGVTPKDRDDGQILQYAKEHDMVVVTADKKFIDRLKASKVRAVTVDAADKATVIHEKMTSTSA